MRLLPALFLAAALNAQTVTHQPAGNCALCHRQIQQPSVAPYPQWSRSMMSQSGVDLYWQARVELERQLNPSAIALIEDKCFRCHQPARVAFETGAQEGVTCTVCHRMIPRRWGEKASFTGGFLLSDRAEIYGPHENPFSMPMRMHTGLTPVGAGHVLRPELCATCHTVITPVLDATGAARGEFLEQAPYLEWRASSFPDLGVTCQTCHLPQLRKADGTPAAEFIAHRPPGGPFPPTSPRVPFGVHELAGGNTQMLRMLRLPVSSAESQLRRALRLKVTLERDTRAARAVVDLTNLTGHKLPTGYPGRRLWLHITGFDRSGGRLFESGADGDQALPQPHHQVIRDPSQIAMYEATLAGPSLLSEARFAKDNRLLPQGFDVARIAIEGVETSQLKPTGVREDGDFLPGSDRVEVVMPAGVTRVEVEALFSSIPSSDAAVYKERTGEHARRFLNGYREHSRPAVVARAEAH